MQNSVCCKMSDKKKMISCKPPVPARPKNLVVLNSKHLPKPPETFSSETVTNFIKDLNLDIKEEDISDKLKQPQQKSCDITFSDAEEDTYGYLEPESLSSGSLSENRTSNGYKRFDGEDSLKVRNGVEKVSNRNSNASSEVQEVEEPKQSTSQFQQQRPLPSLPLPPMEKKADITTMPWYKNVDRKIGEKILKNGIDGYFLVRPSSNPDTYLTLTLWYKTRVYNIPIRKRKDGKFALGTPKAHEQCFDSVELMVKNYQSEKLVLFSHGVQTGKTLLTTHPP